MASENDIIIYGRKTKSKDCENQAKNLLREYDRQARIDLAKLDGKTLTTSMFDNSPHIYLNPTEHLRMGDFVKEGDRVATVMASGDFAFDSLNHGASEVIGFDINSYQYYVAALKKAAIDKLSYEEFFNFFSNTRSNDFLSPEIYVKIKRGSKNSNLFAFWDQIFIQRNKEIANLKKNEMFKAFDGFVKGDNELAMMLSMMMPRDMDVDMFKSTSEYMFHQMLANMQGEGHSRVFRAVEGKKGVKTAGSYLENEKSFNGSRDIIAKGKVGFLKADLLSLKSFLQSYKVNTGFDLIYLSNIPDYLNGKDLIKAVDTQLMPLLNTGGKIVYCAQAINLDELVSKDKKLVSDIRGSIVNGYGTNFLGSLVRANGIDCYDMLSDKYDIEVSDYDTLTTDSTRGEKDVYISVKKK